MSEIQLTNLAKSFLSSKIVLNEDTIEFSYDTPAKVFDNYEVVSDFFDKLSEERGEDTLGFNKDDEELEF